ncbi:MAG: hypothetical protein ABH919_03905 [bacterium]
MNLRGLIEKLENKVSNNKGLLLFLFLAIILTIFLNHLVFLILKIFPCSSIYSVTTISDRILFLTFLALIWYAWETRGMKNEMVTQTELEQRPFLAMYIRKYKKEKHKDQEDYIIENGKHNQYLIRVRNMGKGVALNLKVEQKLEGEGKKIEVEKYQCQILAPENDEQSIKFKMNDLPAEELEDKEFILSAANNLEKERANRYYFTYKIIDIEKHEVEYISDEYVKKQNEKA